MRKFNRLHCDSTVRARFTETFVNGKLARKRFNELKRKP